MVSVRAFSSLVSRTSGCLFFCRATSLRLKAHLKKKKFTPTCDQRTQPHVGACAPAVRTVLVVFHGIVVMADALELYHQLLRRSVDPLPAPHTIIGHIHCSLTPSPCTESIFPLFFSGSQDFFVTGCTPSELEGLVVPPLSCSSFPSQRLVSEPLFRCVSFLCSYDALWIWMVDFIVFFVSITATPGCPPPRPRTLCAPHLPLLLRRWAVPHFEGSSFVLSNLGLSRPL